MTTEKRVQFAESDIEVQTYPSEAVEAPNSTKEGGLFEVFAGSYEKILYGFKFSSNPSFNPSEDKKIPQESESLNTLEVDAPKVDEKKCIEFPYHLTPEFIFPAHIGSIRTIAAGPGRHLSTGSTDEILKLYDLKKRKELGFLSEHNGTITCLKFVGKTHLLSGGEDKNIMIWRTKDWECLKVLKGHKGHINDISPHPSGKLALSVGDDRVLFAWNLMTGQRASSIRLDSNADAVAWSPLGDMYVIMFPHSVHIYAAASPTPFCKISAPSVRAIFMGIDWVLVDGKQHLIIGCGDGSVQIYGPISNESGTEVSSEALNHLSLKGHSVRVKDLSVVSRPNCTLPRIRDISSDLNTPQHFLVTCSSDGFVLVWDLSHIISRYMSSDSEPISSTVDLVSFIKSNQVSAENALSKSLILASYNAKVRLTCLATNFPFE